LWRAFLLEKIMTEHKGLPVSGYKATQPDEFIQLVNENKQLEERILRQIEKHYNMGAAIDQRAIAIAKTGIQEAFMWLNRGVFQPQRISLPEDGATLPLSD
jgi:hypothetical protein